MTIPFGKPLVAPNKIPERIGVHPINVAFVTKCDAVVLIVIADDV
jgi:hypothetical protein